MNLPPEDTMANEPDEGRGPRPAGAQRLIAFQLGGECFCVAASGIFQVVHPLQISALPDSPSWLLGLAAHRGEIVAVLDPRVIKPGSATAGTGRISKTLIFHSPQEQVRFALPVDRIEEAVVFNPQPDPSPVPRPAGRQICEIEVDGRVLMMIDHERLFSNLNTCENSR